MCAPATRNSLTGGWERKKCQMLWPEPNKRVYLIGSITYVYRVSVFHKSRGASWLAQLYDVKSIEALACEPLDVTAQMQQQEDHDESCIRAIATN